MSSRKGRMLPSSLSRSQAYSRLPLAAKALYPLMIANADDQGRLSADPQTMKWTVCPNVSEITIEQLPELIDALVEQSLVTVYQDNEQPVLQLRQWWEDQAALQWAYPSEYLPPEGWDDHFRFRNQGRVITINWADKANGSQTTPLADLATQLSFSRSLNAAIAKVLKRPIPVPQAREEPANGGSRFEV